MSTQPTQLSADDQQVKDFAGKIRAKYPGAYDDMPDFQLSKAIATKHPEYADMLPAGFAAKPSPHSPAGADVRAATPTQFEKDRTPGANGGFLQHVGGYLKSLVPEGPKTEGEAGMSTLEAGIPAIGAIKSLVGAGKEVGAARERGHGLPYSVNAGLSTLAGVNPERVESAAEHGDTGGVLGEVAVPTAMAVGSGLHAVDAPEKIGIWARNVSERPVVRMGLQKIPGAIGAVGGGAAGSLLGPGGTAGGAIAGRELLAPLGRKLFPDIVPVDTPGGTGASLPSPNEFYENAGKENVDIMRRTKAQEATDRAAASRAAKNAPKPAPPSFGQGMVSTANPGGANLELPEVPKGPTPEPAAKIVSKNAVPEKSLIVGPNEPMPAAKTTLQSYPREALARMAAKGDLRAAAELQRNPGGIDVSAIPNLRYIGVRPIGQ